MVSETEKPDNTNGLDTSSEESIDKNRKVIETYPVAGLIILLTAIILITFGKLLLSGCLIFVAAAIWIIVIRKSSRLTKKNNESIQVYSTLNVKKDVVIKEFSHRIREPLNNLVIIVELLLESEPRNKQKELLETLIASTNNMVTILNELTMQSAGNLSFERRKSIKFNILSTIQNTFELYGLKEKVNIDFILNKKELTDYECIGDPIIIKQILLDLFTTIENYSSEVKTKVIVNLSKTEISESENLINLLIKTDNNSPLLVSNVEQSQAAKLITSVGGKFSQEFGAGFTILNMSLPFINPVAVTDEKIGSSKIAELISKEKTSSKEIKDLKVLLVEDNLINQKITLLTLKPLVYSIDTATNGKEALDKFGTSNYDLILMDIQMPVMSGLVAAEKIRELEKTTNSHIPIIAITANAMLGDKEKCLSAGIDDYISKPFQPSALIEMIKSNI
jgi:CheY-like chemotaxis protein